MKLSDDACAFALDTPSGQWSVVSSSAVFKQWAGIANFTRCECNLWEMKLSTHAHSLLAHQVVSGQWFHCIQTVRGYYKLYSLQVKLLGGGGTLLAASETFEKEHLPEHGVG